MILIIFIATACSMASAARQSANSNWQDNAQSIIGTLDYLAIDYPHAVQDGVIINAGEYAEHREFLATVTELLRSLPPRPAQTSLLEDAAALADMLDRHAAAGAVAARSRDLVAQLIAGYDVVTAPQVAPVPATMAPLYAEQCAGCHGPSGRGDGPAGTSLDPAPADFHDVERARQRSLYGLYTTITLGVQGTGMPSFSNLSEAARWSMAFYVAGLRDDPAAIARGEHYWDRGVLRDTVPTLASLTSRTPAEITEESETGAAVLAFLRHHPRVLTAPASDDPISLTVQGLQDSVSAYRDGQPEVALQRALSAYLDGYELIEAPLRSLDDRLAVGIERDMQIVRNMIRERVSRDVLQTAVAALHLRLTEASILLNERGASSATLFASALLILLREGLEAILLLAAMGLYLRRTGQSNALRYLHLGWVGALAAGAVTWVGIKTAIDISGAQREVVEGTGALLAAIVLLYVGIWLHRHSNESQWQTFLNQRLGRSLSSGTLWGIAALSFIAVYREIVETVLFYETLWLQSGNAAPLVSGALAAGFGLFIAGWLVFRIGAHLPLRQFFRVNEALMFVLALVFTGKGVAALQEAGWIGVTFVAFPRIDWLGVYPTAQTVGVQLAIIAIGSLWLLLQSRHKSPPTAS